MERWSRPDRRYPKRDKAFDEVLNGGPLGRSFLAFFAPITFYWPKNAKLSASGVGHVATYRGQPYFVRTAEQLLSPCP